MSSTSRYKAENHLNQEQLEKEMEPFNSIYPEVVSNPSQDASQPFIMRLFGKILFQRLMIFSAIRLINYINKLYEDMGAVKEYYNERDMYYCIISASCLFFPPFLYAIYSVGANLIKDDVVSKSQVSAKTVNGFLLFCWQLKRHLDVLHYTAQRICTFRMPDFHENYALNSLQRNAEVLEFFENFYAGVIQVLLQIYIFMGNQDYLLTHKVEAKPLLKNFLASIFCIFSLMVALRRKDDGPVTKTLSWIGWPLLFASRFLVFSLVATQIHYWLFLFLSLHVLFFSIWVYNIAVQSYVSSSSTHEAAAPIQSRRKRVSIAMLVIFFFGIPSLFYWPLMFQLNENRRPIIYLITITLENTGLLGLWFLLQMQVDTVLPENLAFLVWLIVGGTLGGAFAISLYAFCKPKYTDQVVMYEIRQGQQDQASSSLLDCNSEHRFSNWHQYGVYYDFFDIIFKLPKKQEFVNYLEQVRKLNY